jgi:glycosyltransferase involved in cell wall biosynthesis
VVFFHQHAKTSGKKITTHYNRFQ